MKRTAGVSLVVAATLIVGVVFATSASAAFKVRYEGKTSADRKMYLSVFKDHHDRRRVRLVSRLDVTCEDGSSVDSIGGASIQAKVAADGTFTFHLQSEPGYPYNYLVDATGDIGFRHAEGTFEYRYASLTDDGESQLCGTGPLTWTAERQEKGGGTGMPVGDDFLTFRERR